MCTGRGDQVRGGISLAILTIIGIRVSILFGSLTLRFALAPAHALIAHARDHGPPA
jgi:hypothetical protein